MGALRARAGEVGARARREDAARAGALPAGVSHVLHSAAVAGGAAGADCALEKTGDFERVPLPAAAFVGHGPQVWRGRGGVARGGGGWGSGGGGGGFLL